VRVPRESSAGRKMNSLSCLPGHSVTPSQGRLSSMECNGTSFGKERSLPKCSSSWNKRLRQQSSYQGPLIPWIGLFFFPGYDLYTILGLIQGWTAGISHWLRLRVLGKPYFHVGMLRAAPR